MLRRNVSAFALDNDGFLYALATAKGADLSSFSHEADTSWKKSATAAMEMIRRLKILSSTTDSIHLKLNRYKQFNKII